MNRIRIGVMGCANIARRLMIPAIKELQDQFDLVAVASRTKTKAKEFADLFECEAITGYETILSRNDIDAVYIPLPTGLHFEWITKALNKGKHVYAEKSIAMNEEEANHMVELARSSNCSLMEGYMFQYHQQHEKVKNLLNDGIIGEPRMIRASFGFPPFSDPTNFRYDNTIGGGALKDAAGYVWRCVNFLYGNIFKVKASNVYYDQKGTSIFGSAYLSTNKKISAEIAFGFDNFYQCNYEIWGSKGKITCRKAYTPKPDEITHIILEKQDYYEDIVIPPDNHFKKAMIEFYQTCQNINKRDKHYNDIIFQAKGLDAIEKLSKE